MSNNLSSNGLDGDNMFAPYNQQTVDLSLVGDLESEFATSTLDPEDEVINVPEPIPFATAMEAIHIRDYDVILKEKGNTLTTDDLSDLDKFFATPPPDGGFGMISDSEPNTFAASMEATRIRIRDYDVIIKESGNTRTTDGSKLYKQVRDNTCTRRQDQDIVKVLREYHKAYNKKYEQVCPTPTFFIRKDYAVEHDQKHPEEKMFLDSKNKKDNYYFDREKFKGVQYIRATRFCILDDLIKCARKRRKTEPRMCKAPSSSFTAIAEVVPTEVVPPQPRFDLDHLSTINEDATKVIDKWLSSGPKTILKRDLIDRFWKDVAAYQVLFGNPLEAEAYDDYDRYRQSCHEKNLLDSVNAFGNAMLDWHLSDSYASQMSTASLPPPGGSGGGNYRYNLDKSSQDGSSRKRNPGGSPRDESASRRGFGGPRVSDSQEEDGDHSCIDSDNATATDSDDDSIGPDSGSSERTNRTNSLTLCSSRSDSLGTEPNREGMKQAQPHDTACANSQNRDEGAEVQSAPNATLVELPPKVRVEPLACAGITRRQRRNLGMWLLASQLVIAISVIIFQCNQGNQTEPPIPISYTRSTLEQIQDRDILRCGLWDEAVNFLGDSGISQQEDQVHVILCQAYAAAILGNASKYESVLTSQQDDYVQLREGKVDMVVSHTMTSVQLEVWEADVGVEAGFSFSVPYLYSDRVWGGLPEYVVCAENDLDTLNNCTGLRICANMNAPYHDAIISRLPEKYLITKSSMYDNVMGFYDGDCNVIPSANIGATEWLFRVLGYKGEYVRGTVAFQKDVAAIATRDDDSSFSKFVHIILMGLFAAEKNNVTSTTAAKMQGAGVLGPNISAAVRAVGSFKDVYTMGISPLLRERTGWNLLNNGTTGLLHAHQLERVKEFGAGPVEGGTLQEILKRRVLNCGTRMNRPGFAVVDINGALGGIDVDYCRMLAASVLKGDPSAVHFAHLSDEAEGYAKLQAGEVDVLAGFEWNIVTYYEEPTTQVGYSFSQPYFYSPIGENQNATTVLIEGDNRCLVTREDDPQFASFVHWVAAAPVYAEEHGLLKATANDMPEVNDFSTDYARLLKDAIHFAGNYSEIYERNLGTLFPERGRNAINSIDAPGPQIYVPPGYF